MRPALYKRTDGTADVEIKCCPALAKMLRRLGTRVAPESYTQYRNDEYDNKGDVADYEVYEVYGEGETAEDYPDGDPYADSVWVPVEWAYER